MPWRMRGRMAIPFLAVLLVAGCLGPRDRYESGGPTGTDGSTDGPGGGSWALESFLTGLDQPVFLTHAGDGSGRVFIVEQPGRVRIAVDGDLQEAPFADIRAKVGCCGERGLLSIAFHPEYAENGAVVFSYTNKAGDSVLERYKVSDAGDRIDPATAEVLLTVDQPYSNHNGGLVAYGPDGYLYVGLGDGGGGGDPDGNGQDLGTLLGKILRIDVGPTGDYAVPPDNPYAGDVLRRGEIWASGLRNPWRFSFDRATGDLFVADVGQGAWEEVNHQAAESGGGENYGWNRYEGSHDYDRSTVAPDAVAPVAEYARSSGHCAVTGGYVYRGSDVPALRGFYLLGDYCSGRLWTLRHEDGTWRLRESIDTELSLSSFGEDEDGELYAVHLGGAVYRFVAD